MISVSCNKALCAGRSKDMKVAVQRKERQGCEKEKPKLMAELKTHFGMTESHLGHLILKRYHKGEGENCCASKIWTTESKQ